MKTLTKIIIIFFSILLFTFISENINYNFLSISSSNKMEPFMNQIIIKPAIGIGSSDPRETTFSVLTYDNDYSQVNKYQGERKLTRQPSPIKYTEEPSYVQFEGSVIKEGSGISGVDIRGILGKIGYLDEKLNLLINNDPNTCKYDESRDFIIDYTDELNEDSSEEDIKTYILENLERINTYAFQSSDGAPITDSMKKELIMILDNSSSRIRFKFCCPTEENCLL